MTIVERPISPTACLSRTSTMTTARTMPDNSETIVPTEVDMKRCPRRTQTALRPQATAAVSAKTTARASELTEAQDGRFVREEQPKRTDCAKHTVVEGLTRSA